MHVHGAIATAGPPPYSTGSPLRWRTRESTARSVWRCEGSRCAGNGNLRGAVDHDGRPEAVQDVRAGFVNLIRVLRPSGPVLPQNQAGRKADDGPGAGVEDYGLCLPHLALPPRRPWLSCSGLSAARRLVPKSRQ